MAIATAGASIDLAAGGRRQGACGCPALALRARRARHRDGRGRRRDAAHRVGSLDHRVAAGHRGDPAAFGRGLARRVRQVQGKPAIRAPQPGHEPCRIPVHLLVGMGAPAAWAAHRAGVLPAVPLVLGEGGAQPPPRAHAPGHRRARRAAGRRRLDHGRLRAEARHDRGRADQADAPPPPRRRDPRRPPLGGDRAQRRRAVLAESRGAFGARPSSFSPWSSSRSPSAGSSPARRRGLPTTAGR